MNLEIKGGTNSKEKVPISQYNGEKTKQF
ncbi:MAG: hypothetical protein UU24_C0001G0047, partial [Candidatus Nomurabacteria bacterium GW2011_GWA2_40_9]